LSLKADGMTLVVSSHILAELEDYSDRMVIVEQGRIVGGESIALAAEFGVPFVTSLDNLLARKPEVVVEAASHEAVHTYGPPLLRVGVGLIVLSAGALCDDDLRETLERAVEKHLWIDDPEGGFYAIGVDRDPTSGAPRPLETRASNMGWLLASRMLDRPEHAGRRRRLVDLLLSDEFLAEGGIRTLSAREQRFRPRAYHNGSVWGCDNYLISLALARRGFRDEAQEHLATITNGIRALERSPGDLEAINAIRRATHTLKGAAGMMGFTAIQTISHDSEDLLDVVRSELDLAKSDKRFPKKGTCLEIYSQCVNTGKPLEEMLAANFPWCEEHVEALKRLFRAFVERKAAANVLDYDDLLLLWHAALSEPHPETSSPASAMATKPAPTPRNQDPAACATS
jgi:HPt (histidine-containing phosphotransfer) domain-containing protein